MIETMDIGKTIYQIFGKEVVFEPIGNHDLKRHLVYRINDEGKDMVLKLYFLKDHWNREVGFLRHLKATDLMVPELIGCGELRKEELSSDPIQYMITSWCEGELMLHKERVVKGKNRKQLYVDMGEILARIHRILTFPNSGILDDHGNLKVSYESDKAYFTYEARRVISHLDDYVHDKPELIASAVRALEEELENMKETSRPVLCHNDYGPRNILVSKIEGSYQITGLFDFEHSSVSDGMREVTILYHRIKAKDKALAEAFLQGYQRLRDVAMEPTERLYMLYRGLSICSWAKKNAYEHYLEGVEILEAFL